MSKTRTVGLTAAALMACAPGVASAAAVLCATGICQTTSFTFTAGATQTTHTLSFLGFTEAAAALGITGATLTDVHDLLDGTGSATVSITNNNTTGGPTLTYGISLVDTVSKTLPSPLGILTSTFSGASTNVTLAPQASTVVTSSATGSESASATSSLSAYLTNFTATASDVGSASVTGQNPFITSTASSSIVKDVLA